MIVKGSVASAASALNDKLPPLVAITPIGGPYGVFEQGLRDVRQSQSVQLEYAVWLPLRVFERRATTG